MSEQQAPDPPAEAGSPQRRAIQGVETATAGFVGPTRFGPTEGEPVLLSSFADFQSVYGGIEPLAFEDVAAPEVLNPLGINCLRFVERRGFRLLGRPHREL